MPVTGINTKDKEGQPLRLQFMTLQLPDGMQLDIYRCNEDWIPQGKPESTFEKDTSEIEYHKALRTEAMKENQFYKAASSNPEWTPGYKEEDDGDENMDQGQLQKYKTFRSYTYNKSNAFFLYV